MLARIESALEACGAGLADVVRTRIFVTDISRWEQVGRVHGEVLAVIRPASTMVEVSALIDPVLPVAIEADAEIEADAVVQGVEAGADPVAAGALGPGSRGQRP